MIPTLIPPNDGVIRHLNVALDTVRMKALLQERMFRGSVARIRRCKIERIKYKPGKNCLVCYRLDIDSVNAELGQEMRLSARFYEPRGSHSRYRKETETSLAQPDRVAPLLHLPELDCIVWVFPNDRKLHALSTLANQARFNQDIFVELLRGFYGREWIATRLTSECVHYAPEYTYCLRVNSELRNLKSGETKQWLLYGKTYYDDRGKQVFENMAQLWKSPKLHDGVLRIPKPIAYMSKYKTLWQQGVPGRCFLEALRAEPRFSDRIRDVAASVAILHQCEVTVTADSSSEQTFAQLQRVVKLVNVVRPGLGARLESLVDRLTDLHAALEERRTATLHGDFHLKNVLADDGYIYLIDLDSLHRGDPLEDVASFIAGIMYLSVTKMFSQEFSDTLISLFLRHYRRRAPWDIPDRDLRLSTAIALINERIFRSITRLKAGRLEKLDVLIDLAENLLSDSCTPVWLRAIEKPGARITCG